MPIRVNKKRFQEYKQKVSQQTQQNSSFDDPRFIVFKPGNKYKFRLLDWENEDIPDGPEKRDFAFLETFIHSGKDSGGKYSKILCPTSFDESPSTFKKCKCCEESSKLYRNGKEGNKKDEELYRLYKRKFHGYALVYVIADPVNPENNGSVKIMHYGHTGRKFFKREILGIEDSWGNDNPEPMGDEIGEAAFDLEEGFDLIVSVSKNGEWNDYDFKFARKASSIDIDDYEALEQEIKDLDFDGIRVASSQVEIEQFYTDVMLGSDSSGGINSSEKLDIGSVEETANVPSDIDNLFNEIEETDEVKSEPAVSEDSSDDFDVDSFINGLD